MDTVAGAAVTTFDLFGVDLVESVTVSAAATAIAATNDDHGAVAGALMRDYLQTARSRRGRNVALSAVVSEQGDCPGSGSMRVEGSIDETSGRGTLAFRFFNCLDFGVTLDGEVVFDISDVDTATDTITNMLIDFTLLRVRDNTFDLSVSGTLASQFEIATSTDSQLLNLVARDNNSGEVIKLENLQLAIRFDYPLNRSALVRIDSGRVYDSEEGYVEASTTDPLTYAFAEDDFPASGGPLVIGGANGSALVAVPSTSAYRIGNSAGLVLIQLDQDGNGFIDAEVIARWDELALPFSSGVRRVPVLANDLVYDVSRDRIYAIVPGSAGVNGNSIAVIDPNSATVESYIPIGANPTRLAIAPNGQYLYVAIEDGASVRRFNFASMSSDITFALGVDAQSRTMYVDDIEVLPGSPQSVAISRRVNLIPGHRGVVVYDDDIPRASVTPDSFGVGPIAFGASPTRLYGNDTNSSAGGLARMSITLGGVAVDDVISNLIPVFVGIEYDAGHVYTAWGDVVDPETPAIIGSYSSPQPSPSSIAVRPDSQNGQVHFLTWNGSVGRMFLDSFDLTTRANLASREIPWSGNGESLIRWGTGSLAYRANDYVYLIPEEILP